ncbi:MAG: TlpA disulfide reductase family protein [Candidatus Sedimenticola sp. (ex Thyasira tokunagai)]
MFRKLIIATLLLCLCPLAQAEESQIITLAEGDEIPIQRYGDGVDRILWLPSEFGFRGRREGTLATGLSVEGFEVWLADLHDAYFLPPGRSSLTEVPVEDIAELIEQSQPDKGRLFIMSTGRGAALTLMAVRQWQQRYADRKPLGGLLLFHPSLLAEVPRPGARPDYLPIADQTNQNILLIQPGGSARLWYLDEIASHLRRGGSTLYTWVIPRVSDGFHMRPTASEEELRRSDELPPMLARSARLLATMSREARPPVAGEMAERRWDTSAFGGALQPYTGDPTPPALSLMDIAGKRYSLDKYKGEVVLINFWATWCPPCVKEIPSLGRLKKKMAGRGVEVLSVDVGEPVETVRAFLKRIPAAFPVLLDGAGKTVSPWQIRAFPTTYLIDRQGLIRYAYFGGLEWDAPEVVKVIESLL